MNFHAIELDKVCRVCGKRLHKAKRRDRKHNASEHSADLASVFKIDVSSDIKGIHPPHFCHPCHTFLRFWKAGKKGDTLLVGRVFSWYEHTEPQCKVRKNLLNNVP